MKVFLINIPPPELVEVYKKGLEVISDYCKRHNLDLFVLEKNEYDVDPSWLKCKVFDYVDDDFVLWWDIDLLPRSSTPSIVNDLDFTKINVAIDTNYFVNPCRMLFPFDRFRYNCGLVGVPRSYEGLLAKLFSGAKESTLPSYEQYPMNFALADNDWKDVHELDRTWNCIFHMPGPTSFMPQAKSIHYTGLDTKMRTMLVGSHRTAYFSKVF